MASGTHFFRDVFFVRSPPPLSWLCGRFSWFVISSDVAEDDWPPSVAEVVVAAATGDFLPPSLICLGAAVESLAFALGFVVTLPWLSRDGQSPMLANSGS